MKTFICPQDKQEETARILAKGWKGESISIRIDSTELDPKTETKIEISADLQSDPLVIKISCRSSYHFNANDFTDDEIIHWYWEEGTAGQYTLFLQQTPFVTLDDAVQSEGEYTLITTRLVILDSNETLILPNEAKQLTTLHLCSCESLINVDVLQKLTQLRYLNLTACESLSNVGGLKNSTQLTRLYLGGCTSLVNIDGLQTLTQLTELDLGGCDKLTNVDGLQNLTNLKELNLSSCEKLTNVDDLQNLKNLTELALSFCKSLANVDGLPNLTQLTQLDLIWCESLTNVDGLQNLTNLTELNLSFCKKLTNVDGLQNLTNLKELNLSSCESLTNVDGLQNLTQLRELDLSDCESLTNIDGLQNLTQLTKLDLVLCESLTNVDVLQNLTKLTALDLSASNSLTNVDVLQNLTNLTDLVLSYSKNLSNVGVLENLTKLTTLDLHKCESLTNVDGLHNLTQLTTLKLYRCESLTNVDGLQNLTKLTTLDLRDCESLTDVKVLQNLTQLRELDLSDCESLRNFDVLQNLSNLTKLDLSQCIYLSKIAPLSQLPHLAELKLDECPNIFDIETLRGHSALEELYWSSNPVLGGFVLLSALTHRRATEKIKNITNDLAEKYSDVIPLMRSPEWQVPVLAKAFVLADELEAYEKCIALLREHHRLTLEQWQSYFEQAFLCGSESFSESFLNNLCQSTIDEDDEEKQKGGSSKNEINTLGGLLLALASAQSQYRERALQIAENALQEETVQALREIAPAICLFYEKLGEHETATAWIKKFTDEQDTLWADKIQQSLAQWEIEAGKTDSALKRIASLHNTTLRDQTLAKAILALAEKDPAHAGQLFDEIHATTQRKEVAQALQDQPSFTATPENASRLLIVQQEDPNSLAQFIEKLTQQHPQSEFVEKLAAAFVPGEPLPELANLIESTTPNTAPTAIDKKIILEQFLGQLLSEGIVKIDQLVKVQTILAKLSQD